MGTEREMMDERTFEMLIGLPWPEVAARWDLRQKMQQWMQQWDVTAAEMEEWNRAGVVKTWVASGYQCGKDETGASGETCVLPWSYTGGTDSEEYRQKSQAAEAETRDYVEKFIRKQNQQREGYISRRDAQREECLRKMGPEERENFRGWNGRPDFFLRGQLAEIKYQGSVPPSVFGYSLTDAGVAGLCETLQRRIVEQKTFRDGFLQLRKYVSQTWRMIPADQINAAAEKIFNWCIVLEYVERKAIGNMPHFRWTTLGVEFESRVSEAIQKQKAKKDAQRKSEEHSEVLQPENTPSTKDRGNAATEKVVCNAPEIPTDKKCAVVRSRKKLTDAEIARGKELIREYFDDMGKLGKLNKCTKKECVGYLVQKRMDDVTKNHFASTSPLGKYYDEMWGKIRERGKRAREMSAVMELNEGENCSDEDAFDG